jgi:hypothetical protein
MVSRFSFVTIGLIAILTVASCISLGQVAHLDSLNVDNASGVLLVDGSRYKTIDAAYAECPAAGCTIRVRAGVTPCPRTKITKPIYLIGAGPGGFIDVGTDAVYRSPTILENNSLTDPCIAVGLPEGNSLVGLTLRDFSIQGNKNILGSTAGDGIAIVGGDSATQIRDVVIDNVLSRDAKGNGISIKDNVFLLKINNSQFVRNAGHGIAISNSGSGTPSQIGLSQVTSDLNGLDALNMNGTNVQDVSAFRSTFADSENGIQVVRGSVSARFGCIFCNFENNANAGVLIKDGYGHAILFSGFPADAHQRFGINVDPPPDAGFATNQILIIGNNFGTNIIRDVQFSANLHVGFVGPQATNQASYSYFDPSAAAVVFDVFSGAARMSAFLGITPNTAGGADLGSSALPWNNIWLLGKAGKYGNITTVSNGVPAEYARADLTLQHAAVPRTMLYAVPPSGAGMYRVCFSSKITRPATMSSRLGGGDGFRLIYTDNDDSILVMTPSGVSHNTTSESLGFNTTQVQESGCLILNAKASTSIQYGYGYTSIGRKPMLFSLHIKLEAL